MYVWPELDAGGPIDHNLIAPPGEVTLFATAREHAEDRVAGQADGQALALRLRRRVGSVRRRDRGPAGRACRAARAGRQPGVPYGAGRFRRPGRPGPLPRRQIAGQRQPGALLRHRESSGTWTPPKREATRAWRCGTSSAPGPRSTMTSCTWAPPAGTGATTSPACAMTCSASAGCASSSMPTGSLPGAWTWAPPSRNGRSPRTQSGLEVEPRFRHLGPEHGLYSLSGLWLAAAGGVARYRPGAALHRAAVGSAHHPAGRRVRPGDRGGVAPRGPGRALSSWGAAHTPCAWMRQTASTRSPSSPRA